MGKEWSQRGKGGAYGNEALGPDGSSQHGEGESHMRDSVKEKFIGLGN